MTPQSNNRKELSTEILKGFHVQFAENQRTREQSFLKIVSFLGAVILAYAYVYQNLSSNVDAFSLVAFAAMFLLTVGSAVVTSIAYNFRRDQYVNGRIRRQAKVIGPAKAFPMDYDPTHIAEEKRKIFCWMPDIFLIFYIIFPSFQVLLLFSYSIKIGIHAVCIADANPLVTIVFFISLACIVGSLVLPNCFSKKYRNRVRKWEIEYKTGQPIENPK